MRSKLKNNIVNSNQTKSTNIPITQRRLKTKPALTLMAILFLGNILWLIIWLLPSEKDDSSNEVVATIGKTEVTKEHWLAEMETLYGKDTLQQMINVNVMEQAAQKYKIKVSEEEIDLEIALLQSNQGRSDTLDLVEEQLREQVKSQLILEKVLAKDIVIENEQLKKHYEENSTFYNVPTSYRANMIVVETKEQAETVLEELSNGSEFSVLAREKSLHTASASLGGDIGFISQNQEGVEEAVLKAVQSLNEKEISSPVQLSDETFAIVQLEEIKESQSFTFKEVKEHIARELAMEQLSNTLTPEMFWAEFGVEWFYGDRAN